MEEGGWKLLLVIDTEILRKIKLLKKEGNLLLMTFKTSLFHLPASKLINQKFLSRTLRLNKNVCPLYRL